MGRMLGAFDPEDDIDRPDLNKCPDCGCYFATDHCPLCGKECPPDMRAGVRISPKKPKNRNRNTSGRVQFIPWYHSWWFILIMMFWMPPVGIALLCASPYRTRWKVVACVAGALYAFFFYFGLGNLLLNGCADESYINTDLSEEEYKATCEAIEPKEYYRQNATEGYYTMELIVVRRLASVDETCYLCRDPKDPTVELLLVDCRADGSSRLLEHDRITVWGQAYPIGELSVYDNENGYSVTRPGFCLAYVQLETVEAPTETDTQSTPESRTEGEAFIPHRPMPVK